LGHSHSEGNLSSLEQLDFGLKPALGKDKESVKKYEPYEYIEED